MGHKFISFLLFILINKLSFTQILSVDREIKRDSLKNDAIIFDLFFSGAKIKGDLITLKGKLEYDHFFDNDYFIMCLGTIKSLVNGNEIIQNKGYFQMRFRDDDTRRISPDGFAQYQWNGLQEWIIELYLVAILGLGGLIKKKMIYILVWAYFMKEKNGIP